MIRFRMELICCEKPFYIPQFLYQLYLGDKLKTEMQQLLHTVRLQSPFQSIEFEWMGKNRIFFFVHTRDYLQDWEVETGRIDLCRNVGHRMQSIGYKFFKWKNPSVKYVEQMVLVMSNGRRFTYPQDAEKGEVFEYS